VQGGFQLDPNDSNQPFSMFDAYALAGYNDLIRDALYLNVSGSVHKWDTGTAYTYTWRSRIHEVPHPTDFGWGQVEAATYPVTLKVYGDGALGSRGAALLDDYSDDPGNAGLLFNSTAEMQNLVDRALGCGLQLGIHAIGDAANRQVIEALASGRDGHSDNPGRHRIEHVQIIHPDDIPRLAEHGIIASMQPIHATSDMRWAGDRLGEERLEGAYAWASMLKHGAHLALGSDFPVEPVNPWLGVHAAVTRQRDGLPPGGWRPQETLTLEQALRGFTLDAAWAGFAEAKVGSLIRGKQADFIILDADPFDVAASQLADITVLRTVVGGETVYGRSQ